jgi:dipeptidyl aminopeptidase/acylaminoacyl peptidase
MKTSMPFLMVLAFVASGVLSAEPVAPIESQNVKDGTILETADGFPYLTYEQWLDQGKSRMTFDEARVRSQFPPEKFKDNKDKLRIPAGTYEEWLAQLKRRSEAMLARWPAIEAETRRMYPPELFREFKEAVDCSRIIYASDGLKIVGFILKPRTTSSGRSPVVIYNHGGNSQVGSLDDTSLLRLSWLVRAGYVVIASQYRGCGGSEGADEIGGADVDDVINLIPLIESLPCADPARLGMLGWSRGGLMAYLTLSKSCRISAAVIGSAPTDLFAEIKKRQVMESLLRNSVPGYAANTEAALKARSAQYWPEKLCKTTPVLLLQGSDDQRCVPESALEMGLQLQRCRQPFRLIFFESGSHGLSEHNEEVNRQTIQWFDEHLRR